MRSYGLTALCVVAACAVASLAWGQATSELKYGDFQDANDPLAHLGRQWTQRLGSTASMKRMPEGLSKKAAAFRTVLRGKQLVMVVEPSDPPLLYLDTDRDLDLTDEKAVTGSKIKDSLSCFGAVSVASPGAKGGSPLRFQVYALIHNGTAHRVFLEPAGKCSGEVTIDGNSHKVVLVDGDLNGSFSAAPHPLRGGARDYVGIDLDGDGRLDWDAFEVMPLAEMVRVGGAYYGVTVQPDGTAIGFEAIAPKLGTLEVTSPYAELNIGSEVAVFHLEAGDGRWQLPVGTYTIATLRLRTRDEAGDEWVVDSLGVPEESEQFEIREGQTTSLRFGPPLTLRADVRKQRKAVSIGLELTGQAGERYLAGASKNGERQDPPTLKILDEEGKELPSGCFKYG